MKNLTCSICQKDVEPQRDADGVVYWTQGHNAEPVNNGRCCDDCNYTVVLPARMNGIRRASQEAQNERIKA